MSQQEVRFDNKAGQAFVEEPTVPQTQAGVVDGVGDERMPPGTVYDALFLDATDMKDFGIENAVLSSQVDAVFGREEWRGNQKVDLNAELKGDWVIMACRDPGEFKGKEVDRVRALKRKWKTLEVCKDDRGVAHGHMDNLYVKVTRNEYESMLRSHNDYCKEFKTALDKKTIGTKGGDVSGFNMADDALMDAEYQRTHNLLQQPAMGAGQYPGMSYEDIVRQVGPEKIMDTEIRAASGGRTVDTSKYAEFLAEQKKSRVSRAKNRSYSFAGSPTR